MNFLNIFEERLMNKRLLTMTSAIAFFGVLTLGGCTGDDKQASAQQAAPAKTIQWKLAMTWPDKLPPFADTVHRFAKNVGEMSGGRLTIRVDDRTNIKPLLVFLT